MEQYLADLIKELRSQQSLSQLDLAYKAEISLTYLRNIEKAKANPTIDILRRVADALGVKLVVLLVEENKDG